MTTMLDLPDDALGAILAYCPFKTQSLTACVSARMRAAVDSARAAPAMQRRADRDRLCREGLPLVGELRAHEDTRLAVPAPHAAVLQAYDRAAPPPPGPEGALHALYRQAADVFAREDEMADLDEGVPFLGPKVQYLGPVDAAGKPHGFGIAYVDDGNGGRYVGDWCHGGRSGFGLFEIVRPTFGSYHGEFHDDAPTGRGELTLADPSQFTWEALQQAWLQALAPLPRDPRDALLGDDEDAIEITDEEWARMDAGLSRLAAILAADRGRKAPSSSGTALTR